MQSLERWKPRLLSVSLLLVAALSLSSLVDRQADAHFESLFQRALVTFALARTLNGVISAVQGTELALQPAGVGLTLTPGEVLDPVNDLVERFSWVMLGATVSLGIQQVLMDISAWWAVKLLVAALCLGLVVVILRRRPDAGPGRSMLVRALLLALFVRFAVPLTLVANDALFRVFLESRYVESSQVIAVAGSRLEDIGRSETEIPAAPSGSLTDRVLGNIGQAVDSAARALDLQERVERIRRQAADMIEHLIQLSVVFILQTALLPIAFLWLFLQAARWLIRPLR
jgi:hypothetical protein